jgi:hypothetical protein
VDRADLIGRFRAVCHAIRGWASANPHEYALTYGSPVPGYHAPQDTIGPATRVTNVLSAIVIDGAAAGILRSHPGEWLEAAVRDDLTRIEVRFPGVSPAVTARGLVAWTEIFGAVSFELFGRLDNVIFDRDAWFEHQVTAMARYVGLRP